MEVTSFRKKMEEDFERISNQVEIMNRQMDDHNNTMNSIHQQNHDQMMKESESMFQQTLLMNNTII